MTQKVLTEQEKMQQVPGIVFADGPTGRRARVAGTGIEVFEVMLQFRTVDSDWDRLRQALHWLREDQLRAALAYAQTFPEEIDPIVDRLWNFDIEELYRKHPFMNPNR